MPQEASMYPKKRFILVLLLVALVLVACLPATQQYNWSATYSTEDGLHKNVPFSGTWGTDGCPPISAYKVPGSSIAVLLELDEGTCTATPVVKLETVEG